MLPILHLNGYKIANPAVLARIPERELMSLLEGYGHTPTRLRRRPGAGPPVAGGRTGGRYQQIALIQREARLGGSRRPVLAGDRAAHPEGLDRPARGRRLRGRGHAGGHIRFRWPTAAPTPSTSPSSSSGCAATAPRSCSTPPGRSSRSWPRLPPKGDRRMSANPHANGGLLLRDLAAAGFPRVRRGGQVPGHTAERADPGLGHMLRDVIAANQAPFRLFGPDETASNRLSAVFEVTDRTWNAEIRPGDDNLSPERPGHGGAVRAPVPGLAGGLPADRPARAVQLLRGLHPHRRLDVQPAREVAEGDARHSRGGARSRR